MPPILPHDHDATRSPLCVTGERNPISWDKNVLDMFLFLRL